MIKIFADTADSQEILKLARNPLIQGFTTNPSLMRKAGVTDYEAWARALVAAVPDKPFSFEVLADEFDEMERQARKIASWGESVYVKIPITNSRGESACPLIHRLSHDGVRVNVTAIFTLPQILGALRALWTTAPALLSVFAGRIADAGEDAAAMVHYAVLSAHKSVEVLWASPREVCNVYDAERIGCDIITLAPDLLKKLELRGKDLGEYSLETVQMFRRDALEAGYTL